MPKITQAVILCAGLGTRLRPVTDNIPKVMVPIVGKPLLERHIEQFRHHGVTDFFINLHYLPETITEYFGDGSKWGVKITYAFEPTILGTAGGVKNFEKYLNGDFFLMYGDMVSLIDYSKMEEAFYGHPGAIGMVVVGENDHPEDSDLADIGPDMRFLKLYPKPHKELPKTRTTLNAAYIFNKRIFGFIPAEKYYEVDHALIPGILSKDEKIYAYETEDYLHDIGTMERYDAAQEYFRQRPVDS
ncbi:MAG: nucleotidyltransferase family protein [bacterium]|nr:nucleotidyltransferase family protein [bacterium]